jgi:hypothetical protein
VPERFDLVVDALEESALDARPPAPATVRRRGRKPAFEK